MCGILAISTSEKKSFQIDNLIKKIKHRGPDDQGVYISKAYDAQLAHVRLSIVDLSPSGHQPMPDSTERYIIVYNGEIYNYAILKEKLEKKYGKIQWVSSSDTEVILEGFAREGYLFFENLNGIFSFVIYDKLESTFHVLRDPLGVKPLYYTSQNRSVFFCSELKGILDIPHLKKTLRMQSLVDQLTYMYVPEPFTMYEEYYKFTPGKYAVYRSGEKIFEYNLFKSLHTKIPFTSENDMIACFRETLSKSVKRQLMADVPVSLFLSGGLDSSTISYLAQAGGGNIKSAYTISFSKEDSQKDSQGNDLFYADKISRHLNLSLHVIKAEMDLINLLPEILPYLEDGISDPAAINTYLICKLARKDGVKVMLSGQGADEYLCGYRRYLAEKIISKIPLPIRRFLSFSNSLLPSKLPPKFNAIARRINRIMVSMKQPKRERLPGYFMWTQSTLLKEIFLNQAMLPGKDLFDFFDQHKSYETIDALLLADQWFDLLSLNLAYNDKMSMAVGVEARVPFLDFELVRLMNSIPITMKIRHRTQKYILKKSMEPYLPKDIIYRSKAGFSLPLRSWLRNENPMMAHYFNQERINKQGIFDTSKINQMLSQQYSGKEDFSYTIFAMLCQQIWLEKELKF